MFLKIVNGINILIVLVFLLLLLVNIDELRWFDCNWRFCYGYVINFYV